MAAGKLGFDALNAALKAAGEETRLRMLALLAEAELTVSDLTDILRQSQPRISRHLKLLAEAGLVERFREGAWAFFRLAEHGGGARGRARAARAARSGRPGDRPRPRAARRGARRRAPRRRRPISARTPPNGTASASCMSPTTRSRRRSATALADKPFRSLLDLGTGTGRMLELFGAADRARARPRSVARHAAAGARPARARRPATLQRAAGRHLRPAARRAIPSTSSSCIRCCTSSTTARARSARRRACCARAAGCWSSTSRRTSWNSCASSMPIAASALRRRR